MDKLTISSHFVVAALRGAKNANIDISPLLKDVEIDPTLLEKTGARITGRQYTQLMQQLWLTLDDEFMGFSSHHSKPGTFATMCYLIIHCHSLESVYKRAQAFYGLFDAPITMHLTQTSDQAILSIVSEAMLNDPDHFLQESLLVIWHRLSCWLTGQRIILDEACFNYPCPAHVDEYRHLFYCPLKFDQPRTEIRFKKRFLQLPIVKDELALKEFLKSSPQDLLARPDDRQSYTARIRAIIGNDLSQDLPDFDHIASDMHLSPQTLRRRLKEENTSYQEIKDHLRRDQAIYYLSRNDYPINEIAHLIGFTEPSTFHRAFKKWTGLTPGAYRQGERAEDSF
jgi:AraC-like DNA-binding protein